MRSAVATMPELTSWQEEAAGSSQQDADMIYYAQDDDHDDLSMTDSFCNLMETLNTFNEHDNEAWANASKNTVATLTETDAMQASTGSLLYVMKGETPAGNNASMSDFNSSYRLDFTFEQDDDQKVQAAAPWLSSAVVAKPSSRKIATFDVVKNDDLSTLTEEPVVLASSKSSKRKKTKKSDKKAPKAEKKRADKKDKKKKASRCKSTDMTVSTEIVDQAVSNICAIGCTERPAVRPIVQKEQQEQGEAEHVASSVATAVETVSLDSQPQQQEKRTKEEVMSLESQFQDAEDDVSYSPDSGSCSRASLPKTIHVQDDCNDSCASLALTDLDDNKSTASSIPTYFRSRQITPMLGKTLNTAKMWVPDSNESVSSFPLKDVKENKQEGKDENDNKVDYNQSSPELFQAPATPMVFRSRPIAPMKSASARTFLPVRATQMTIDLKAKLRGGNSACPAVDSNDQAPASPGAAGELYQLRRETGFKDLGLMQHIEECSRLRQTLNSVGDPEVLRKQKIADYIEQFKRQKPRGKQTHGLSEVEVKTQRANLKPTRTKQKYGLKMQEEHNVSS